MTKKDRLSLMFEQQKNFMDLLQEKRNFPNYPVDLSTKTGQKFCKSVAYEMMGELFEAIQELKNSKDHRVSHESDLNKSALVEELADVLHYYNELLILMNVSPDDIYEAYMAKGEINEKRIKNGY